MGPLPMPEAEVPVDARLAEALVAAQHGDLSAPARTVAEGWDNVVLRLGEHLAVRLPRRRLGAELVAKELRWLPDLAPHLPLAVPVPVRAGHPDAALGYPYPWSIVRWIDGETALDAARPLEEPAAVEVVAGLLDALASRPVPVDGPRNPYRGVPLADRSGALSERLDLLPSDVDRGAVVRAWERALAARPLDAPGGRRWIHGDLHPGNLIVADGRIVGVVDWGDLAVGDRACDLGAAWMILGSEGREQLRARLGVDGAEWDRARGNALAHAVAVLAHSADSPAMAAMGRRTVEAVLADDEAGGP